MKYILFNISQKNIMILLGHLSSSYGVKHTPIIAVHDVHWVRAIPWKHYILKPMRKGLPTNCCHLFQKLHCAM